MPEPHFNRVLLTGSLVSEPELRESPPLNAVQSFVGCRCCGGVPRRSERGAQRGSQGLLEGGSCSASAAAAISRAAKRPKNVRIRYGRTERPPIGYAIVLETRVDGHWTAIRLWDNAHDADEHHEHEYTSTQGKLDPTVHPFNSVNQAMAAAMTQAAEHWPTILENWRSR